MQNLNLIYFSPTGTTKKIVETIGQSIEAELINKYDLSPSAENTIPEITKNSLTIIGIPVYGGRLPQVVEKSLSQLHSENSPVVLVVVYGNRAFDDALLELKNISQGCGFKLIAAAAFIGEHSFSNSEKLIAPNRPDEKDLVICKKFADLIQQKLQGFREGNCEEIKIPGNFPYRERSEKPVLSPETEPENCNKCGVCAEVCPTNAISINGAVQTEKEKCIWCCACVKLCPQEARTFNNPVINGFAEKLSTMCKERKEPELFL